MLLDGSRFWARNGALMRARWPSCSHTHIWSATQDAVLKASGRGADSDLFMKDKMKSSPRPTPVNSVFTSGARSVTLRCNAFSRMVDIRGHWRHYECKKSQPFRVCIMQSCMRNSSE